MLGCMNTAHFPISTKSAIHSYTSKLQGFCTSQGVRTSQPLSLRLYPVPSPIRCLGLYLLPSFLQAKSLLPLNCFHHHHSHSQPTHKPVPRPNSHPAPQSNWPSKPNPAGLPPRPSLNQTPESAVPSPFSRPPFTTPSPFRSTAPSKRSKAAPSTSVPNSEVPSAAQASSQKGIATPFSPSLDPKRGSTLRQAAGKQGGAKTTETSPLVKPNAPLMPPALTRTDPQVVARSRVVDTQQVNNTTGKAQVKGGDGSVDSTLVETDDSDPKIHTPQQGWRAMIGNFARNGIPPGYIALLLSAFLWGTSPPALRFLYRLPEPPSPAFLAASQNVAAALLLAAFAFWQRRQQSAAISSSSSLLEPLAPPAGQQGSVADATAVHIPKATAAPGFAPVSVGQKLRDLLNTRHEKLWAAGFELGLWGFLANAATVLGFQYSSAAQGAFILRLSAVFTPLVAAAAGDKVPLVAWLACSLAFGGGCLMVSQEVSRAGGAAAAQGLWGFQVSTGGWWLLLAAVMWAVQTFRIGRQASRFEPLQLASWQLGSLAACSSLWLLWEIVFGSATGHAPWGSLFAQGSSWWPLLMLLWPAVGAWTGGTLLQLRGQNTVPAPQAMVIYSTDPLWATLFAGLIAAQEQQLGTTGAVGASFIVLASLLVVFGTGGRYNAH